MSDFEFYFNALRDDLQTVRKEINERLDTLNGSVKRHETEIALLKSVSHPQNSCPIVFEAIKDIERLQKAAESHVTTEQVWRAMRVTALATAGLFSLIVGLFEIYSYLK